MADADSKPARLHKATFARDKRNPGKYLIRVVGPTAAAFAGRTVPVTRQDNSESMEKLTVAVWSGIDEGMPASNGRPATKGTGLPVALYAFEAREREDTPTDDLPF
jgi:hypothetical protein